jgi:hypothetical protein
MLMQPRFHLLQEVEQDNHYNHRDYEFQLSLLTLSPLLLPRSVRQNH